MPSFVMVHPPMTPARLWQACLECQGAILFTGIGKSGFIAQKACSSALPACHAPCMAQNVLNAGAAEIQARKRLER